MLYLPNTGQNSFELTKFEVKNGTINYTLQNIGTQTINIPSFNNQRISLFVDNLTQTQTQYLTKIYNDVHYNKPGSSWVYNLYLKIEFENLNTILYVYDPDINSAEYIDLPISKYFNPGESPFTFKFFGVIFEYSKNFLIFTYQKTLGIYDIYVNLYLSTDGDFYQNVVSSRQIIINSSFKKATLYNGDQLLFNIISS